MDGKKKKKDDAKSQTRSEFGRGGGGGEGDRERNRERDARFVFLESCRCIRRSFNARMTRTGGGPDVLSRSGIAKRSRACFNPCEASQV